MDRIATEFDAALFGISAGSYIVDSVDKNGQIVYYFAQKDLVVNKGLKDGATIWFDGRKLKNFGKPVVKFCNTSDAMSPWLDNVKFGVIGDSFECSEFNVGGVKNLEILKGIKVDGGTSGHCFNINVRHEGSVKMRGFDTTGGSTGVRIGSTLNDIIISNIDIADFRIRDTFWEGFYIGSTKSTFSKFSNVSIRNGKIIRSGAEAVQLQHIAGTSVVEDVMIVDSGNNYLGNPTADQLPQNYQDCGIQLVIDSGKATFNNIVIQGWANNGITIDSSSANTGQIVEFKNTLLTDGKGLPCYIHNDYNGSVKFSNTYCVRQNFDYFRRKSIPINYNMIDGNKTNVKGEIVKLANGAAPLRYMDGYINVTRWAPVYPKWFTAVAGQPVVFDKDEKIVYGTSFYSANKITTGMPGQSPDWDELDTLSDCYDINPFLNRI